MGVVTDATAGPDHAARSVQRARELDAGVTTDDMRVPARSEVRAGPRRTRQDTDVADQGSNRVGRAPLGAEASVRASRAWWDAEAPAYAEEHGRFLGDGRDGAELVWGPEGWTEVELGLLGPVAGRRVLEVGAGGAQGARWLASQGAWPVALDLSHAMLAHSAGLAPAVPLVQADAARLPFADGSFDLACSAYGALPFVADAGAVFAEVARVLRSGGRWVCSVTHPVRWAFPDSPDRGGLVADRSYFDRTPYLERDESGVPSYVEHHRTLGDTVRALVGAGLQVIDLVEPEWPERNDEVWGGWSPLRGAIIPGTAIWVSVKA
jgi:SAM-dependent methyltransferase